jgi:hypothetical protein
MVVIIGALVVGIIYGLIKQIRWYQTLVADEGGWLWFASEPRNKDVARVGVTDRDPDTFKPEGVQVIYKVHVDSRREAFRDVASNLETSRVKGHGYEKQAVLAYIDHLKGVY